MRIVHNIEPIYDSKSEILILGSFPSIKSREAVMYYSHPQNRFWKILSKLFNEEIEDKREFLLRHKIALWDVIKSCEIEGSSDATIKNIKVNNIKLILKNANIKKIFVEGKKALSLYNKYILPKIKIEAYYLSSTSSAYASKSLEDLVKEYEIIKDTLEK